MFTASRKIRTERNSHNRKAVVLIAAALVFANATALFGLTATAHAGDFPDALRYAPMTWEKQETAIPEAPVVAQAARTVEAAAPVTRQALDPVKTGATPLRFTETRTPGFLTRAGAHHRYLVIALMTVALGAMGGVSVLMFRGLAREISETQRKRDRF